MRAKSSLRVEPVLITCAGVFACEGVVIRGGVSMCDGNTCGGVSLGVEASSRVKAFSRAKALFNVEALLRNSTSRAQALLHLGASLRVGGIRTRERRCCVWRRCYV